MAVTQVTTRNVCIENVTQIPKSAAKVAAAFLVLQPYPYVVGHDLFRAPQAHYFQEPEVQIQPWKGSLVVVTNAVAINPALDKRIKQAQFFQEPEVAIQPQKGSLLTTLTSYAQVAQTTYSVKYVSTETTAQISSWKVSSLVINSPVVQPAQSADLFNGNDTYGWPPDEVPYTQTWKSSFVVLNTFSPYVPGHDLQRAKQAQYYPEVEFTIQPWRSNVVVLNTFVPYVPSHDIQRAHSALWFPEPESYLKTAPYNEIIINGTVPGFTAPVVLPTMSVWTADATKITADTIDFTWDGADLVNGGSSGTPTTVTKGGIAYTVSTILRF